ncbi:methyltransferase, putative [Bodo saltans]|uniref:phosphoethanolamine N-methyltransferase n=1 Tax=Bodo saltans TaxID=75058 RepID=A0A0S4KJW1_BODSA|nr:methyltransferase, putative [Bodo saltans]|eukprot:CUI14842.1 methyltransferase, putative [Bodo saltans]
MLIGYISANGLSGGSSSVEIRSEREVRPSGRRLAKPIEDFVVAQPVLGHDEVVGMKRPGDEDAHLQAKQQRNSQRENVVGVDEPQAGKPVDEAAPGRGLKCPQESDFNELQIPLKHLPRGKKTSVAEKYNRRAHNCASNGIWNRVTIDDHHRILHDIVKIGKIQKNSFVLDWGSGCGHSLQFLFDEYDVTGVGIDVSNLTIAYARTNTTKADLHCVADGTKLEWIPSNFFDHALSFGSIYHVYNRTMFCHVIRQLVRIVKPGGTVYNGWTENGEYKRVHVPMCLADLDVDIEIVEEKKGFADVAIFPLKAQQTTPNTYSLVVTKKKPTSNFEAFLLDNIPITCGVHVCTPRQPTGKQDDDVQQQQVEVQEKQVDVHAVAARSKVKAQSADEEGDKEGWPSCPNYDANIERLQIPLEHLPRKKKTSVAQKYDRRAHNCASHGIWHRVTIADHEAILKRVGELLEVKKDEVLLDWGSGCGHQLEFMTRMFGAKGLGVDVSNLTIAYAVENTTKVNRHCVADGSRLEWIPSNFFDHAYSFGSIYHVYNKSVFCSVLQQMVRVVKPGGKIYNGWTENKEFHRNDLVKCINTDTNGHHEIRVLEEGEVFHHVANFPLKQYRQTPNTYSLVVVKAE